MTRRLCQLFVALMVAALPLVATASPAWADNVGQLLGLVNGLRAAHGAAPLTLDPTLNATAQMWSAHMAATSTLSHNPNYGAGVGGSWTKLGENVGEGGVLTAIFNAFVNSTFHYDNMVDPSYNLTGIAVVTGAGNTLWVTQDFEARSGGSPAGVVPPATNPPPATTAAPVPPAAVSPVVAPRPTTAPARSSSAPAGSSAPTHPPIPSTASPTTAAPTTAAPTTILPSPSRPATVDAGSGATATTVSPQPQNSTGPGRLAAAGAPFSQGSRGTSGALVWSLLVLFGLAVVSTVYFVKNPR